MMRPALFALACTLMSGAAGARPKLGVLLVFDQLRAAEIERYQPFFGAGGFGGLDGARYDASYDFAATETGPGHATLATGANPRVHGVATNRWYVGTDMKYVVEDPAFPVFFATDKSGRSAAMLAVGTLGDAMKIDSGMRAKVVTLSIKDRAAILTGGRSADLAIWYDSASGRYTSSTAYVKEPPAWLAEKGASLPAAARASATWTPLPVPKGLEALVPVDERPGEGGYEGWGTTFPHTLQGEPPSLQNKLYRMTPESMEDLFTLALVAVDEMKLGADAEPDLLVVSVSTTDYIGHNYGPDSREQLELLRRADAAVRAFMANLEKRVGRREVVVVVSSDHGSTPPPLALAGSRAPAGVLVSTDVEAAAERGLHEALPKDAKKRLLGYITPQVFLDTADLPAEDARRAIDAVRAQIARVDGVAHVYDMTRPHDDDAFAHFMDESAPPGRHAQLFVRQLPRYVVVDKRDAPGTDHGSPYTYDRRVPVIVAGPGVTKGRYADAADPRDVAPTLAFLLGVPPPDACQGRVLSAVSAR